MPEPQPNAKADVAGKEQAIRSTDISASAALDLAQEYDTPAQPPVTPAPAAPDVKGEAPPPVGAESTSEEKATPPTTPPAEKGKEAAPPSAGTPEPFAQIGNQTFKTKEELVDAMASQQGYNRWLTGQVKRLHPDWFDAKGKLLPSAIQKAKTAGEGIATQTREALENPDVAANLTDTEKTQLKDLIRGLGFVPREDVPALADKAAPSPSLDDWLKSNPKAAQHLDEVHRLISATADEPIDDRLTLDDAWAIVAYRHKIALAEAKPDAKPETPKTYEQGLKEGRSKTQLDGQAAPSLPGASGVPPKTAEEGDVFDAIIGARGI